jgi:hypothetical protein
MEELSGQSQNEEAMRKWREELDADRRSRVLFSPTLTFMATLPTLSVGIL